MFVILLVTFLFGSSSQASLNSLADEYLKRNTELVSSKLSVDAANWSHQKKNAEKSWVLSGSGNYQDSQLESSSTFSANPVKTTNYDLAIGKSFGWGGELSFSNTFTQIEQSGSFSALFGTNGKYNSFGQTVSYSQDLGTDFFGRSFKKELEISLKRTEAQQVEHFAVEEEGLLSLSSGYIQSQLQRDLLQHQKQALKRAIKRKKLVTKRVRDGLREKVDLLQARVNELKARESVKSGENSLSVALEGLSLLVHRKVSPSEIESLKESLYPEAIGTVENNQRQKALKAKKVLNELSADRSKMMIMPTIKLETSYSTNNYDVASGEAISGGMIGEDNNVWKVGVKASWPIGFGSEKSQSEIDSIEKRKTEYQLSTKIYNDNQLERFYQDQLRDLSLNLKSAKSRAILSEKVLSEYNGLYAKGRASLDQVINAEEELIRTQSDVVRYQAEHKVLTLKLYTLYGSLKTQLLKK